MRNDSFFEPTAKFKEYVVLKTISQLGSISQQKLAKIVGVAPSMVNKYLSSLQANGFIQKSGPNKKRMNYLLTDDGKARLQYLTVSYFSEVARLHKQSRETFRKVFETLQQLEAKRFILYGAGVIGQTLAELLLNEGLTVVCLLDDDPKKQGKNLLGIPIFSSEQFVSVSYDAILIASFRHADEIFQKAKRKNLRNIYIFRIETSGEMYLERRD